MNKKLIIILSISIIALLSLIFKLSSADTYKSNGLSKKLIYDITTIYENITNKDIDNDKIVDNLNYPIRKIAHYSLYFILGILIYLLLKFSKIKYIKSITFVVCLIYATLDELHQTSILGRTGQPLDVIIDIMGSMMAIMLLSIIDKKELKKLEI